MDKKTVYNAICGIDESHLEEYDGSCNEIKKHGKTVKRVIACGVCLAAAVAVGLSVYSSGITSRQIAAQKTPTETAAQQNKADSENAVKVIETTRKSPETTASGNTGKNADTPDSKTDSGYDGKDAENGKDNNSHENKGGDTPEMLQDYSVDADGYYYRIFNPETDTFAPSDEMSLENRFCAFSFNGKSYYPAQNGELASDDYGEQLGSVKAYFDELLTPDEDIAGIEYRARIDIYRLNGIEPDEAVACVIYFNGEKKEYRYNATDNLAPSWP